MVIRQANPETDAAGCLDVYGPFVDGSVVSFEDKVPSEGDFAQRIERLSRTHAYVVADDGDHIVGFAYAGPYRERAAYRWTCEASVYIGPDHHRRGVGRRLYAVLFDLLEQRGYRTVVAAITLPNDASVGLHRSCGFIPVGTFPQNGFKYDSWLSVTWLTRRLGPPDEEIPPAVISPPARLAAPIEF